MTLSVIDYRQLESPIWDKHTATGSDMLVSPFPCQQPYLYYGSTAIAIPALGLIF